MAVVLGLLLLVAPVSSAVRQSSRWLPQGDNGYIAMRAHDVGTAATPLVGQPSTSHEYDGQPNVDHPGPFEFYLLAPLVRLFDDRTALLIVATAISAVSLLTAAWAVFRRWGSAGGLIGVVALAVVMWSKGAAALVQPISSNIGWLPLLATTVLVWGLVCRDWRLLPVAVVFVSFTAQQHLAVVPVTVMVVAWGTAAIVIAFVAWRRRGSARPGDRDLVRRCGWSLALGVLCWLPVIVNAFVDFPGNTVRIVRYAATGGGGSSYGPVGGVRQVLNAIGFPPLLSRTEISGEWLVRSLGPVTVATALLVVAGLVAAAVAWRRTDPTFTRLVVVGGGVALGGFLTGMTQPNANSADRISYYHWAFTLGFIELLAVGWVAWKAVRHWLLAEGAAPVWLRTAAPALAAVLVLVPGIAEVSTNRRDRDLTNWIAPATVDRLADVVRDHRDVLGSSFVVILIGGDGDLQLGDTVAEYARKAGLPATFAPESIGYVAKQHTTDPCTNQGALVLGLGTDQPPRLPGRHLADVPLVPGWDLSAFLRLSSQAKGRRVVLGPALQARLADEPKRMRENDTFALEFLLGQRPGTILRNRHLVSLLAAAPPTSPALDRDDLRALAGSFPDGQILVQPTVVAMSAMNRAEVRERWPQYAATC